MVVSLILVLNFSIVVSASSGYDRQEADTCITISQRLSVKGGSSSDIDRIKKGAQQSYDYAVNNPRQSEKNEMQIRLEFASTGEETWLIQDLVEYVEKNLQDNFQLLEIICTVQ